MGINTFEMDFSEINEKVIQIYGANRCGKTVLIHQLHPYSSININGDDRNDINLILAGETGVKEIAYKINDSVYIAKHTYTPRGNGHSISSSLTLNGEELNPSGGVQLFNSLIETHFGLNKYAFQFWINGTQLLSLGKMSTTQRKTIINKAAGIDIYDKIHKLSTDDHRYMTKMITSLNNSKEYLMQSYGSFEDLKTRLEDTRTEYEKLTIKVDNIKSIGVNAKGKIDILNQQDIRNELARVNAEMTKYNSVIESVGVYNDNIYDMLIDKQMKLNAEISKTRLERLSISKDLDAIYAKRNEIKIKMLRNSQAISDLDNLKHEKENIESLINELSEYRDIGISSSDLSNAVNVGRMINAEMKEIIANLGIDHIRILCKLIREHKDVNEFIFVTGTIARKNESESSTLKFIESRINEIEGIRHDDNEQMCEDCVFKKRYNLLMKMINDQATSTKEFTVDDVADMEYVYKHICAIFNLIRNMNPHDKLKEQFSENNVLNHLEKSEISAIDIDKLYEMIDVNSKIDQRKSYESQLENIMFRITNISTNSDISNESSKEIEDLNVIISEYSSRISEYDTKLNELETALKECDNTRLSIQSIKDVNINELRTQFKKLTNQNNQLDELMATYDRSIVEYNEESNKLVIMKDTIEKLSEAYNQFVTTNKQIEDYLKMDDSYKIISEATSTTKGKPVYTIRQIVDNAMVLANKLIYVIYENEIELMDPVVDESSFTIPFRHGVTTSADIKYGSQSEETLLSLALSLALGCQLSEYNIPLIDEIDAFMDQEARDNFVPMLEAFMSMLKMEQLFLISHNKNIESDDVSIHRINLSEEIKHMV